MDKLEDIKLSEISPSEKDKYCMIPSIQVPGTVKFIETQSRIVAARGRGKGGWGASV